MSKVLHPEFDFKGYLNRYSGHARILRTLYIAERSPDFSVTAFHTAVSELLHTSNTTSYTAATEHAARVLGVHGIAKNPDLLTNNDFVVNCNRNYRISTSTLTTALQGYKQQEDHRSTKDSLEKLGDLHASAGMWSEATSSYDEANSIRTNEADFVRIAGKAIKVGIDSEAFVYLDRNCSELAKLAKRTPSVLENNPTAFANAIMAGGLYMMRDQNKLKKAAEHLLGVPLSGVSATGSSLLHPADLVSYVCLIGLATFSRAELNSKILTKDFKRFLEFNPHWSQIIQQYLDCEFAECTRNLHAMKLDLLMDKYLGKHVVRLMNIIQDNAIVAYFKCFGSLRIPHIAGIFAVDDKEMERCLINLIGEDKIKARIDSANKIVYARQSSARNTSFQGAMKMGDQHCADLKSLILTLSITQNNFHIAPEKKKGLNVVVS
jgi:COP9 signalosome complex subunit 1